MGAFIIFLLAIFGLFYQHFFVGQISGYSADKIHGREAVAINRRIAEKYSGDLSEERVTNIIKNHVNPPAGRPLYLMFLVIMWQTLLIVIF